jgi:hypothetical protein
MEPSDAPTLLILINVAVISIGELLTSEDFIEVIFAHWENRIAESNNRQHVRKKAALFIKYRLSKYIITSRNYSDIL